MSQEADKYADALSEIALTLARAHEHDTQANLTRAYATTDGQNTLKGYLDRLLPMFEVAFTPRSPKK